MKPSRRRLLLVASATIVLAHHTAAAQEPLTPHRFLEEHIGFSDDEIRDVEKGKVVTEVLKTSEKSEVAVFGIVRLAGSLPHASELVLDVEGYANENTTRIAAISDPPRPEDFALLSLPEKDIESLAECRPGKCDVKLPGAAIERFQSEIDWKAPDHAAAANALFREILFDYATAYRKAGNRALMVYHHEKDPAPLAESLGHLLGNSPYLYEALPELYAYLESYPQSAPAGVRDFFYWSVEEFGLKPTIRMTHVTVLQLESDDDAEIFVATKLLYASHYYRGSLAVYALAREPLGGAEAKEYVVSLERTRADGLTGMLGAVTRGKLTAGMEKRTKVALEQISAAAHGK
ncbi:MAG: hypothetical protein JSW67_09285 [Candidatus Latescibacterota bacterium]|nr:MAG: hypothetical protein JSW67_09285 [Candidatus Latescibacterota bacterium]